MHTNHPTRPVGQTSTPSEVPASSVARRLYLGLTAFFWLCVMAQAFLAGAGIFASGSYMRWHIILGHLLSSPVPVIPLFLLVLSFSGRLPSMDKWLCACLFFLAIIQPFFLYLREVAPMLGALHPLNALFLFALPMYMMARIGGTSGSRATSRHE